MTNHHDSHDADEPRRFEKHTAPNIDEIPREERYRHHDHYYDQREPFPSKTAKYVIAAVIVLAVGAGAFAAGFGVGRGVNTLASGQSGAQGGYGQRGGFMRRGGFGTVSSVSDSSITITESGPSGTGGSATKTYAITSSTTVTNNGSTAAVSDIKTGDTVRVQTSSTTSTDATAIEINPSYGGGAAAQGTSGTSDSTDSTDSTTPTT